MSTVRSHGATIYYERHGQGPAVLFCHGAGSNAATWWQQIPEFSKSFTCLTYDHRCFGRSPASPASFSPKVFVDDALAILDAEGIAQAALVCQSLGGITGLRLALWHPDRVWAFVSCDSPLGVDHEQMRKSIARSSSSLDTCLEERALGREFLAGAAELTFLYGQINRFNPAVYAPDSDRSTWRHRILALLDSEHTLSTGQLAKLGCPTLFVVGSEDPLVTPEITRDIAKAVRGAEVIEIGGAGHSPYFEKPARFNACVSSFLHASMPIPSHKSEASMSFVRSSGIVTETRFKE